jgi:hypothetical protein
MIEWYCVLSLGTAVLIYLIWAFVQAQNGD